MFHWISETPLFLLYLLFWNHFGQSHRTADQKFNIFLAVNCIFSGMYLIHIEESSLRSVKRADAYTEAEVPLIGGVEYTLRLRIDGVGTVICESLLDLRGEVRGVLLYGEENMLAVRHTVKVDDRLCLFYRGVRLSIACRSYKSSFLKVEEDEGYLTSLLLWKISHNIDKECDTRGVIVCGMLVGSCSFRRSYVCCGRQSRNAYSDRFSSCTGCFLPCFPSLFPEKPCNKND